MWLTWLFIGNQRFYYFITVFDFQIQIMPNFFTLNTFFYFFIFMNTDLLFWTENPKLRISSQAFSFSSFINFSKTKLISHRSLLLGLTLQMTYVKFYSSNHFRCLRKIGFQTNLLSQMYHWLGYNTWHAV